MKKLITIVLLLLLITPCLRAQRKELSQARSYIKSGKDLDKAEKLITDLLKKDSDNLRNVKIYQTWYQIAVRQYDIANEALYLKQKYDTANFFNYTRRMVELGEKLDSVEMMPDDKGRVKLDSRKRNAEQLNAFRPNLFAAGSYFIRKNNFKDAYSYLNLYLDCARQPLFADYNYSSNDKRMPEAAYWASYCGFKLDSAALIRKYADLAMKDTSKLKFTMQYLAEAYRMQKIDTAYFATLKEGFARYPVTTYYFSRLMDYYTDRNQLDSALALAEKATKIAPDNQLFLFAKCTVLLNMGRYQESIMVGDSLLQKNDTLAEAQFNVGTAYMNMALKLEQKPNFRKYRKQTMDYYQEAKGYMEAYRKLQPGAQSKWGPALYRIYLNLNMGKQFDEIDKLLNH